MAKEAFHDKVAQRIIEQLKQGTAPWQKPWDGSQSSPYNPVSGTRYRGANNIYLACAGHKDPRWMTYKQASAKGYQVRKGEKSQVVQYWKFQEQIDKKDKDGNVVKDEKTGKPIKVTVKLERPKCFHAAVFNAEQMDGVPKLEKREYEWEPNEKAEQILKASGADIRAEAGDRAYYSPIGDYIVTPEKSQFSSDSKYYATALHELGHWTGHSSRLDRDLSGPFGSQSYAKEELRAEIGSMLLGEEIGIGHDPSQHVAYVGSWIKALEEDPKEIIRAARDAEQVMGYVLDLSREQELEKVALTNSVDLSVDSKGDVNKKQAIVDEYQKLNNPSMTEKAEELKALKNYLGNQLNEALGVAESNWDKGLIPQTSVLVADAQKFLNLGDLDKTIETIEELAQLEAKSGWFMDERFNEALSNAKEYKSTLDTAVDQNDNTLSSRLYIKVDYKDRAEAKALGAKWDGQEGVKSWFVPPGVNTKPFEKWKGDKPLSNELEPIVKNNHPVPTAWQGEACRVFDDEMGKSNGGEEYYKAQALFKDKERALDRIEILNSDGRILSDAEKLEEKDLKSMVDDTENWLHEKIYYNQSIKELMHPIVEQRTLNESQDITDFLDEMNANPAGQVLAAEKTYLAVPYNERNNAKALGAKWDKEAKSWYSPEGSDLSNLKKWIPEQGAPKIAIKPEIEFQQALEEAGLKVLKGHPIMDGRLHRIDTIDGPKGNKAGAYKGFLDGHPAGFIQNHQTGVKSNWKASGVTLSPEERAQIHANAASNRQKRDISELKSHEHQARRCEAAYNLMPVATADNGYLKAKGIEPPPGAREDKKGRLVVPLHDKNGKIWSLQRISSNGFKSMKKGARKSGNMYVQGNKDLSKTEAILICEGVATGGSVHMASGLPVVVAFDAGNLQSVADTLRETYPDKEIVILGDDDKHKENTRQGNRGRKDAENVAERVNGAAIFPTFSKGQADKDHKDWNDLHKARDKETVNRQIRQGLSRIKHKKEVEHAKVIRREKIQERGRSGGISR